jgi:DNA mismatch repair protein MutL
VPKIARLPDEVVNQIAAGEVVERPASVVKELIENALDAQATRIAIDIEQGGKRLIRVRDDGEGIMAADLALALERHATSKLRTASDLEHIASSGFRGEALPSIGSVAELAISSRTRDASEGAQVSVSFSRAAPARPAAHPAGTTVEVKNLFAEIPARRKFLRAESTELRHAVDVASLLAMARPDVGFTVRADGRDVMVLPPSESMEERVAGVLGRELATGLVPVDLEEHGISVSGFVSRNPAQGGARPDVRVFVNGRPVRDRGLSKALSEAYRALGHFDPKPVAVLFVDLGFDMVDVNVHPAKTEVRFREPARVFQAVVRAVRKALSAGPDDRSAQEASPDSDRNSESPQIGASPTSRPWASGASASAPSVWPVSSAAEGASPFGAPAPSEGVVLGQFRDTYIVAAVAGDLWLFDQHTSHERARFERIEKRKAGERVESQGLLTPAVVEVSPGLALLAEECMSDLAGLGFEVESFGPGAFLIRAIPELLAHMDPAAALRVLVEDFEEDETPLQTELEARIIARVCKRAAIKAGQVLQEAEQRALLRDLESCQSPRTCPHGRPTMIHLSVELLERQFGRRGSR